MAIHSSDRKWLQHIGSHGPVQGVASQGPIAIRGAAWLLRLIVVFCPAVNVPEGGRDNQYTARQRPGPRRFRVHQPGPYRVQGGLSHQQRRGLQGRDVADAAREAQVCHTDLNRSEV